MKHWRAPQLTRKEEVVSLERADRERFERKLDMDEQSEVGNQMLGA